MESVYALLPGHAWQEVCICLSYDQALLIMLSPGETPTADDIAKFCISIVNHVKPVKNSVPSFRWLESALETTVRSCEFHYKSFTYDRHDKARAQAVLNTLLPEGKVTRDRIFERKWAGCVVVRILVIGLITDAWLNRTIS